MMTGQLLSGSDGICGESAGGQTARRANGTVAAAAAAAERRASESSVHRIDWPSGGARVLRNLRRTRCERESGCRRSTTIHYRTTHTHFRPTVDSFCASHAIPFPPRAADTRRAACAPVGRLQRSSSAPPITSGRDKTPYRSSARVR